MNAGGRGIITWILVTAFAACTATSPPPLSKAQYEQKVQTLYAAIQAAFAATRGAEGQALADRIGSAQKALRDASRELLATRPPVEVSEENQELARAIADYAEALEPAVKAAATGDREALARFGNVAALGPVREMAEAAEKMKYKGYDLGPIAKD